MNTDITGLGVDSILVFEVIARLKSLKLAANELSISQPAVTHSLNKLEGKLNVQLCIRTRTHFALTEPGKRLFAVATNVRAQLKDFQGFLREDEEFDGFLNLSVLDNFNNDVFDSALKKVIQKFPKMKLNMQVQSAGEIQKAVFNGEADMGFGIFNEKLDSLVYRKVGEEHLHYYISRSHPLWSKAATHKKNLKGFRVAWVDTVFRRRPELESHVFVDRSDRQMKVAAYTNNLNCALSILKSGKYVVPLPLGFLESQKVNFKYKVLDSIRPISLSQSLVFRPGHANSSKAADFFLEEFKCK